MTFEGLNLELRVRDSIEVVGGPQCRAHRLRGLDQVVDEAFVDIEGTFVLGRLPPPAGEAS